MTTPNKFPGKRTRGRLAPRETPDVPAAVLAVLAGMTLVSNTELEQLKRLNAQAIADESDGLYASLFGFEARS